MNIVFAFELYPLMQFPYQQWYARAPTSIRSIDYMVTNNPQKTAENTMATGYLSASRLLVVIYHISMWRRCHSPRSCCFCSGPTARNRSNCLHCFISHHGNKVAHHPSHFYYSSHCDTDWFSGGHDSAKQLKVRNLFIVFSLELVVWLMRYFRNRHGKHVRLVLQSRRWLDTKSDKGMDNMTATKLLKSLYTEHKASPYPDLNEQHIRCAFSIFDSVYGDKNYFLVNSLLKCCLHFDQSYQGIVIWDEIQSIANIDYSLIIKCCIRCHRSHPDKCIDILHSINRYIKRGNIAIKSALITAFGQCGDIKTSWSIFNDIPNDHKNIIVITAMMKCCINHHEGAAALTIYDQFNEIEPDIHNEVSRLLAIRACIESDEWHRGTQLIALNAQYDRSLQFKTTQIEFYGHFGDIDSAFRVFHSVLDDQKDAICIGAMLKALVNAGYSEESLSLYDNSKYSHLTDDVSNVLAIKVWCFGTK